MLKFPILLSLALVTPALAGPSITGGGKGVVCRSSDNRVLSVEPLDLWEAENLFSRNIVRSDAPVEQQVNEAIQRMKDIQIGSFDNQQDSQIMEELNVKMIQEGADVFFGKPWPRMTVKHLHGVTLTLSQDSFEDARPSDCNVEQVILYDLSGNIFYINDDLFDLLPKTDQAALILHESLYSLKDLPQMKGLTPSSVHVRRAVGYLFSGGSFNTLPEPLQPRVSCQVDFGDKVLLDVVAFSQDPETKKTLSSTIFLGYPGEQPMGYFQTPIKSNNWAADKFETLFSNQECKGEKEDEPFYVADLIGAGPVDFDRVSELVGICKKGKFQPYWQADATDRIAREKLKPLVCKRHNL